MPQSSVHALEARALQLSEPSGLLAVVAPHPRRVLGAREALRQTERARFPQKAVEDCVWIRSGGPVPFSVLARQRLERLTVEEPKLRGSCRRSQRSHLRAREWSSRSMIAVEAPGRRGATKAHTAGM